MTATIEHSEPAMMKRDVVRTVLEWKRPPYVPWSMGFTKEAKEKLLRYYGCDDLEVPLDNHLLKLGSDIGFFEQIGQCRVRDVFGVVWDRSVDKDIGNVEGCVLAEPTLAGYEFPDPLDPRFFADIPAENGSLSRSISGLSDRLLVVRTSVDACVAWPISRWTFSTILSLSTSCFAGSPITISDKCRRRCVTTSMPSISATTGGSSADLQMGPQLWREFILPVLRRMYGVVREAGKFVMIHSCGDVDELFDDLIDAGVNCFNPFQPEVMDIWELLAALSGSAGLPWRAFHPEHAAFRLGRRCAARNAPAAGRGPRRKLHFRAGSRRGRRCATGKHAGGHRTGAEPTTLSGADTGQIWSGSPS